MSTKYKSTLLILVLDNFFEVNAKNSHEPDQNESQTVSNLLVVPGFELMNHEGATARGECDSMIIALGIWVTNLLIGVHTVFFRILTKK